MSIFIQPVIFLFLFLNTTTIYAGDYCKVESNGSNKVIEFHCREVESNSCYRFSGKITDYIALEYYSESFLTDIKNELTELSANAGGLKCKLKSAAIEFSDRSHSFVFCGGQQEGYGREIISAKYLCR